jgi:hypothetical protein
MNYVVSVNEAKGTVEVVIEGKYKGVAKCNKADNYNLQVGIELALERAKVAKANAEKPKVRNAEDMSIRELGAIIERKLGKGQVVIIGEGRVPSAEQREVIHSYSGCKGGYDEGYAEGYDDGYSDAYDEIDAVEDDDDDCDEDCDCDCDCDCHKVVASQGVVVMSGSGGSIGGAMVRKMIEEYERKMRQ